MSLVKGGDTAKVTREGHVKLRELHQESFFLAHCTRWNKVKNHLEHLWQGMFESTEQREIRELKNMHAEDVTCAERREFTHTECKHV